MYATCHASNQLDPACIHGPAIIRGRLLYEEIRYIHSTSNEIHTDGPIGLGDIRQSGKTRDSRTPNRDKLSLYTPEYKGNLLIQLFREAYMKEQLSKLNFH